MDGRIPMIARSLFVVFLALAAGALAGCQEPSEAMTPVAAERPASGSLGLDAAATRLGLKVLSESSTLATLSNGSDRVRLFAGSQSRVYLNGTPLTCRVPIVSAGGTLFVPREIIEKLRQRISPAPRPTRTPALCIPSGPRGAVVVLDAGHGGKDPGAIGVNGLREKDVNLSVARRVAELLGRAGVDVRLTRGGDGFLELDDRAAFSNRARAELFVSIHANSYPANRNVRGFDVYVARSASDCSVRAARTIAGRFQAAGIAVHGHQPKRADYRVLVKTAGPAVLVELGFLSNPSEANRLRSSGYQRQLAAALADGILAHLGS
jgi:N-acetylmuramoyl-L-alanine amidase